MPPKTKSSPPLAVMWSTPPCAKSMLSTRCSVVTSVVPATYCMWPWSPKIVFGSAVAGDQVVAVAAEDAVAAGVAVDHVVAAVLRPHRRDVADEAGRLDLLEQRVRLVRVGDELRDAAVVAEDHVVVAGLGAGARGADRARALAVERVAAGDEQQVDVRRREARVVGRDRQAAREDVDVDAGVAVDLVVAAQAEDRSSPEPPARKSPVWLPMIVSLPAPP